MEARGQVSSKEWAAQPPAASTMSLPAPLPGNYVLNTVGSLGEHYKQPTITFTCTEAESKAFVVCWKQGCAPNFRLFPTTGTCSGHTLWTCVCFWTSRTSRTCFGLSRFRLRCCWIGSARSGSRSHGYPIIARSTELRQSSAALPYVLPIASSCSADSGLTQPPAATYASPLTHAVCPPMYLSAPGLASCSSV
jgi:hypothetical protein